MVDTTAGIGEAGALINRVNAPTGMDITRGIQMAERNDLRKAQIEAAKAAKAQARAASIAKASRVDIGKFKNLGVAKEAEKIANDLYTEFSLALESGDYESQAKSKARATYLRDYLASKDNAISELKSPKKYDYANKVGELINSGKEEDAAKFNKAYAPVFVKGQLGDYIVEVPDATDLNKVYSNVLKSALRNDITFGSLADAATGTDNYSVKRKMTPNEIAVTSDALMSGEGYMKSVLYDPDFQKFYDKKYGGSGDPQVVEQGVFEYTKQRIEDLNQQKIGVKGKPTQASFVSTVEGGIKIGNKTLPIESIPAQQVYDATYNNQNVDKGESGSASGSAEAMRLLVSKNPTADWKKVKISDLGEIDFIDETTGKPVKGDIQSIYSDGNTSWILYNKKRSDLSDKLVVTPMTSDIFNRLFSKIAGDKKSAETQRTINELRKNGIVFRLKPFQSKTAAPSSNKKGSVAPKKKDVKGTVDPKL